MKLFQKETGYRYNSDTLLLYDFISSFNPKGNLLDVGCGCGILALLLKRDFPHLQVNLLDIQEENCAIARANATQNNIEIDSFTCKNFLESSFEKPFDIIVSNPPFYHAGSVKSDDDHLTISRHSSYLPLDTFAKHASKWLVNKGYFIVCYDAKQSDALIVALMNAHLKIEDMRFVHTKADNDASLVLIRARKNSKTMCKVHPSLTVMEASLYSLDVQAIFEKSQTRSYPWQN